MGKNKFKVGDIVTCTKDHVYAITTVGIRCKVISINTSKRLDMVIEVIEDYNLNQGCRFNVSSRDFKKVTTIPFVSKINGIYCKCIPLEDNKECTKLWAQEILENLAKYEYQTIPKGNNTIIILSDNKWNTVKVGIARCKRSDEYNADIGKAIAAARAMGVEIPNFVYE